MTAATVPVRFLLRGGLATRFPGITSSLKAVLPAAHSVVQLPIDSIMSENLHM